MWVKELVAKCIITLAASSLNTEKKNEQQTTIALSVAAQPVSYTTLECEEKEISLHSRRNGFGCCYD